MPDLNISEKACDHEISSFRKGELYGGLDEGRYENRLVSSKCFDDSQVGLLLQGCLALSNGELNRALTSFR